VIGRIQRIVIAEIIMIGRAARLPMRETRETLPAKIGGC
jgi:hypothetical protein